MSDSKTKSQIVELNVGGVFYTTTQATLLGEPDSLIAEMFADKNKADMLHDTKGKYFIDRDGVLFRYVLDYLRNLKLVLPENFHEKERLKQEAEHYKLPNMVKCINSPASKTSITPKSNATRNTTNCISLEDITGKEPGFITIGYRGTFAFGRDGLADVKFRKMSRVLVCGRVSLCRNVFKDTLNESRDPDRGSTDRYTSRYFLKHTFVEQAFDMLAEEGFKMVGSMASATNNAGEIKAGMDTEEARWQHYNEFVFERK